MKAELAALGLLVLAALASCHRETRQDSQERLVETVATNSSESSSAGEKLATSTTQGPGRTVIETFYPPAIEAAESPDAGVLPARPSFYPPAHGALQSRTIISTGPVVSTSIAEGHQELAAATQTNAEKQVDEKSRQTTSVTAGPGWKFYLLILVIVCAGLYALYRWAPKIPFLH